MKPLAGHTDQLYVLHYSHFSAEQKTGKESPELDEEMTNSCLMIACQGVLELPFFLLPPQ